MTSTPRYSNLQTETANGSLKERAFTLGRVGLLHYLVFHFILCLGLALLKVIYIRMLRKKSITIDFNVKTCTGKTL